MFTFFTDIQQKQHLQTFLQQLQNLQLVNSQYFQTKILVFQFFIRLPLLLYKSFIFPTYCDSNMTKHKEPLLIKPNFPRKIHLTSKTAIVQKRRHKKKVVDWRRVSHSPVMSKAIADLSSLRNLTLFTCD